MRKKAFHDHLHSASSLRKPSILLIVFTVPLVLFIFCLFGCDVFWDVWFPPSEDELPLYEWEVLAGFTFVDSYNSIYIICLHKGSGAPRDIYTNYNDRERLNIIELTSLSASSMYYQYFSSDLTSYYNITSYPSEELILIELNGVSPSLDPSVDMEISFDTETIFYLYSASAPNLSGAAIYGKCRITTPSITIQYR